MARASFNTWHFARVVTRLPLPRSIKRGLLLLDDAPVLLDDFTIPDVVASVPAGRECIRVLGVNDEHEIEPNCRGLSRYR